MSRTLRRLRKGAGTESRAAKLGVEIFWPMYFRPENTTPLPLMERHGIHWPAEQVGCALQPICSCHTASGGVWGGSPSCVAAGQSPKRATDGSSLFFSVSEQGRGGTHRGDYDTPLCVPCSDILFGGLKPAF